MSGREDKRQSALSGTWCTWVPQTYGIRIDATDKNGTQVQSSAISSSVRVDVGYNATQEYWVVEDLANAVVEIQPYQLQSLLTMKRKKKRRDFPKRTYAAAMLFHTYFRSVWLTGQCTSTPCSRSSTRATPCATASAHRSRYTSPSWSINPRVAGTLG